MKPDEPDEPDELDAANTLLSLCREADLLQVGDAFPLAERCSSSDSVKASSGEVSPYDNNSPLLYEYPADGDASAEAAPVRQHGERSGGTSPSLSTDKGDGKGLLLLLVGFWSDQFSLDCCNLNTLPRVAQHQHVSV